MLRIIFLTVFVLSGCIWTHTPSKLVSDFYSQYLSISDQMSQFRNYTIEEQYELFIFGNQVVHPPATYLAEPFAKQGVAIIPFLSEKLKATTNELTIRDITLIFSEIAKLKLYNFPKDMELMNLLNQKIDKMQSGWKNITLEFFSRLQTEN